MTSEKLQGALLDRVRLMQAKAVKAVSLAQKLYKRSLGKHIKRIPTFKKNDLIYSEKML